MCSKQRMKYSKGKARQDIAKEHISELYNFATNNKYPLEYRKKAAKLILKISQKFKLSVGKEQKILLCKRCNAFLLDPAAFSIRLKDGHLVYKCKNCGEIYRIPYNAKNGKRSQIKPLKPQHI